MNVRSLRWLPLVFCLVLLAAAAVWGWYLLPE